MMCLIFTIVLIASRYMRIYFGKRISFEISLDTFLRIALSKGRAPSTFKALKHALTSPLESHVSLYLVPNFSLIFFVPSTILMMT